MRPLSDRLAERLPERLVSRVAGRVADAFAPGAWRYAVPAFVVGLLAGLHRPVYAVAGPLLGGTVLAFYRDPDRSAPAAGVVSPADGRVSVVRDEGDRVRIGVFMNVTDVHVNRAPLGGTVRDVTHTPGANQPAFAKDSDRNERVRVAFDDHDVVLIAGWFARRIHPYVAEGDHVARGDRIGHISFGSRADVVMPPGVTRDDLAVARGDRVTAGETVLADWPTDR